MPIWVIWDVSRSFVPGILLWRPCCSITSDKGHSSSDTRLQKKSFFRLAAIPFGVIIIYTRGQKRLHRSLRSLTLEHFLEKFKVAYRGMPRIRGTALFFLRDVTRISPYIVKTMFANDIIYEDNILVSIAGTDLPFGVTGRFKKKLTPGLRIYEIKCGDMEVISIERLMRNAGIDEKTIFYGLEDIATNNVFWKIFSLIKRISPTFIQFHKLPAQKLHGVVTRVEL